MTSAAADPAEAILLILRLLLAAALYAFLILALRLLAREHRAVRDQPAPQAWLLQLDGDGGVIRRYELHGSAWIGRDPNCTVCVGDEFASARHARIEWDCQARAWWLEDNASRNGTWMDDDRVTRRALASGDVFRTGATRFRFKPG